MERVEAVQAELKAEGKTGLVARFASEAKGHGLFWVIALLMLTASIVAQFQVKPELADSAAMMVIGFFSFWLSILPALLVVVFFRMAVYDKSPSPIRDFIPAARRYLTEDGRFLRGFSMMLVMYAFINGFSRLKSLITYFQPFSWDVAFDTWDRTLHFGYRPWELLQPVLGYGPVSMLINVNYNFWFVSLTAFWLHFAFAEKPGFRRTQAILAYMITWIAGGVALATFFSSAGPCYFGNLNLGFDPYRGLMTYLHATHQTWPIWAVDLQDTLWLNLITNEGLDVSKGISAMPSMHNAQCLLLVLASWNRGRLIRNLAVAHGVLVFIGSIHLGWHYAVDAYLGYVVAGAGWLVATKIARGRENRRLIAAPAY